jgi:hypothetical protein
MAFWPTCRPAFTAQNLQRTERASARSNFILRKQSGKDFQFQYWLKIELFSICNLSGGKLSRQTAGEPRLFSRTVCSR